LSLIIKGLRTFRDPQDLPALHLDRQWSWNDHAFLFRLIGRKAEHDKCPTPRAFRRQLKAIEAWDHQKPQALSAIRVPTLVAHGEDVLGQDLAGKVERVGANARAFKGVYEVYARPTDHRIRTFAEQIAVDQVDVALKSASLLTEQAASIPLVEVGRVKPGQRVFIQAGAAGEDLVLYMQDAPALPKSITVLKPGGMLISMSGPPDVRFSHDLDLTFHFVMRMLGRNGCKQACAPGADYTFRFMPANGSQLAQIAKLIDDGAIRPGVDRVFAFAQTQEAIAYIKKAHAKRKVLVSVVS
tara:strand:- start:51885 stop:52778 length:894 start_codon:yes stop_codon:yes gene_type:complete